MQEIAKELFSQALRNLPHCVGLVTHGTRKGPGNSHWDGGNPTAWHPPRPQYYAKYS